MDNPKNSKTAIILLLLLAMAGVGEAQTQSWPQPGAEWTYCLYANGDAFAKEVWRVTGDSLIDNRVYNVIQPVDSLGYPLANSGKMLLTRYANDTVYRFVNNREYLFFAFNLNEGDVFTTFRSAGWGEYHVPNYGNDSACCSLKPLLVTEKKEVDMGGITLNEYTLKDTLFAELYGYDYLGYWRMVDRIGPIDGYPLIDINETGSFNDGFCFYDYICAPYVYLSAYRDDTFEQVWYECNPTMVAEKSMEDKFEVYPIPTSGIVHIKSKEVVAKIQVYNSLGQLVKTIPNTNEVSLEGLPEGVYLLRVTLESGKVFSDKVVKE